MPFVLLQIRHSLQCNAYSVSMWCVMLCFRFCLFQRSLTFHLTAWHDEGQSWSAHRDIMVECIWNYVGSVSWKTRVIEDSRLLREKKKRFSNPWQHKPNLLYSNYEGHCVWRWSLWSCTPPFCPHHCPSFTAHTFPFIR